MGMVDRDIANWVDSYADEMYRYAYYRVSHKEVAEDLVQEAFLAASASIDKFRGDSQPKTWLFSILKNKILDHHRKAYRSPAQVSIDAGERDIIGDIFDKNGGWRKDRAPSGWDEEQHLLDDPEFLAVLQICLEELPDRWFSAVQLKYLEEKKGKDICEELSITPANFWQILHRAKMQLRDCIDGQWFNK